MHCWATMRSGRHPEIENTGRSTRSAWRPSTTSHRGALDFIDRAKKANKPFFLWSNSTRMHIFTHLKPSPRARPGSAPIPTAWSSTTVRRQLLDKLDELGIADNTIVMYSTDNGAEEFSWPGRRHHALPRREEHQLGRRLPRAGADPLARRDQARHDLNEIFAHEDMLPTLLAAAGEPDVKEKLLNGHKAGDKPTRSTSTATTWCRTSRAKPRSRRARSSSTGPTMATSLALRYDHWKVVFLKEQRAQSFDVWPELFVPLRVPKLFNLRSDPFERADKKGIGYDPWRVDRASSCWCRPRRSSPSGSRASRTSRRARSLARSS